ncbi:MAG: radical SAM protein [Deltaproteobacteria bacterium HGW-Deltaproteobacteria-10]|nr:MAG: radical SAM protein [Deltaproteobacteria bacterium HGW-Deltaproteobacteria-10]
MEFQDTIATLKEIYKDCTLCPRMCHVDRTQGELGYCRMPATIMLDCALPHSGEEPPLSGTRGAGTLFFSSCNLGCIYCQNYQISHVVCGQELNTSALAQVMLDLQKSGCHNIEPVTPTPQTPLIMEALLLARGQGLKIPFVYNCGGYENPQIIKMLDNMVDIYLPDFKYGVAEDGAAFSGVSDYPRFALDSLKEMVRQVGAELEMENEVAQRGVIVRHLILPGRLESSREVFRLIKKEISTSVAISLMSQYTPTVKVQNHPQLGRRITASEYQQILDYALDLGFENLFIQEVSDDELMPDFNSDKPFG